MVYIYIKNKSIKKVDDSKVVLIVIKDPSKMGKNRKYEIFTKDAKNFTVKKKSKIDVKNMTKRLSSKKNYFLKVKEGVWINTEFLRREKETTFLMDKIREHEQTKRSAIKCNCCCYSAKCPSCGIPLRLNSTPMSVKTKWAHRYNGEGKSRHDDDEPVDDNDALFYKKSK
jgi:hypothetical protein